MRTYGAALRASFRLGIVCPNCRAHSERRLDVPDVEDAPSDVQELLDSAFLQQQRFACQHCEGMVGVVRLVEQWKQPQEACHG